MPSLTNWLSRGSRALAPVGARLVALIVIAAIPVVFMAGTIAWQNYHLASDRALQSAVLIRQGQAARNQAVIDGTEQMLGAVAQVPAVQTGDGDACHDFLASVIALDPSRYADLAAFGPDGEMRCAAAVRPVAAGAPVWVEAARTPWFTEARDTRRFTVSPVHRDPATRLNVLVGAYPVIGNGRFLGEVAVAMRVDWLNTAPGPGHPASATWLTDRAGALRPVGASPDAALPPPAVLATLLGSEQAELQADAVDGTPYAYAAVRLSPDLGLLIGYRAARERQEARDALVGRIAELGLLLLVGVVAVWFGGTVGVVDPIARLSRAVGRWRDGRDFDPGPEEYMPAEVRQLSRTFMEATRSLGQRERQLRTALAQQELLMQEIHHRVKNNLQIVASLLNLQASRIRVPAARAEFQAARDRVRALATLHRHLYAHGELHTINMRSFLTELCGQLFQAMGEREGGRIQLDDRGARAADDERPGGAALADRHRGGDQRGEIRLPRRPLRPCLGAAHRARARRRSSSSRMTASASRPGAARPRPARATASASSSSAASPASSAPRSPWRRGTAPATRW